MFNEYYADLHIHIGRSESGDPIKVTASRNLTFPSIAGEACTRKGLDLVGIVDCASPPVQEDIEQMLEDGELVPLEGGGYHYQTRMVIIPASELETTEKNGRAHFISYFPDLNAVRRFTESLADQVTNITLSSQQTGLTAIELEEITTECSGFMIPAHAFTPHRSLYGCAASIGEVFGATTRIPALELGLSADMQLALGLKELAGITFLSNSDAHSLPKIGREHNAIRLVEPSFEELLKALNCEKGREIVRNYGLDPRLGKYHRTYCPDCEWMASDGKPVLVCPECGNQTPVVGVWDRVSHLAKNSTGIDTKPVPRGDYIHQLPLEFIPGIGPRTRDRLLDAFHSEMEILHTVSESELKAVVGEKKAQLIAAGRAGRLRILPGGGGKYGKVTTEVLDV